MSESPFFSHMMGIAARVQGWTSTPLASRIGRAFSAILSVLILLMLVRAIVDVGWHQVVDVIPANPLFWLAFVGSYLLHPFVEWLIYRRWWKFGWEAMGIFLKMRVMNDALFAYSGHTYLLVWAARRMGLSFNPDAPPKPILGRGDGPGLDPAKSPFAAVKDMAITSGLAGNFATLVLLLIVLRMGGGSVMRDALDPATLRILLWSFVALIVMNVGLLAVRSKVMSLPTAENMFAFRWHLFRVLAVQALLVWSWAIALPGIAFNTWFLLGALRMVIMRLPVPNKEILFAAVAVSLTEDPSIEIAALMAAQGALQLIFHVVSWAAAEVIYKASGAKPAGQG